jgi:lipoprotein-anchoring transpeptidase ErfK/SrfK
VRSRSFVLVALSIALLIALAGGMLAYDSSRRDVIAAGIKVGGVDIGGLSAAQARAKLRATYLPRLRRPVLARFGRTTFRLTARESRLRIDVDASVAEALSQTRSANIFTRTWRSLTGGRIDTQLDPHLSYSPSAVTALVKRVAARLSRPARDASISYSGAAIGTVSASSGLAIDAPRLTASLQRVLSDPVSASHVVRIVARRTAPKVTTEQLAARYPTIITVDRSGFSLRLWKNLRLVKRYTIAVGQVGLETPAGLYHVQDKEVDPSWHVPNSSWAGALAGQTIPPGPQDPLKARWMGIFNGAGIHGTEALSSLGSAASHGCIRMAIPDVIELYDQTQVGTPVYIA